MVRMMATGPEAAKMNAASAPLPYRLPKSAMTWRSAGGAAAGRSIRMVGYLERSGADRRRGNGTVTL
jgi:hypothetical protein